MLHVLMEYVMFWILSPYQEHNCQYQYKKLLDVVLFDTGGSIDLCFFLYSFLSGTIAAPFIISYSMVN